MSKLYPISLKIKNSKCLVVGGGQVALRKVNSLLACGADLVVVSPEAVETIQIMFGQGKINYIKDIYKERYLEGCFIVVGATNCRKTNAKIFQHCQKRGLLINVVDNPEFCNFYVPAVIQRRSLQISVSTEGKCPLLAKKIKEHLSSLYPEEYGDILDILGELRQAIFMRTKDPQERSMMLSALLEREVIKSLQEGNFDLAKERIKNAYYNGGS